MTMFAKHFVKLSLEEGALPSEFRLFVKGWNDTENGKFLFDDKAARNVMAAYESWGVDLAIDLEHQMLEVEGGAPDPTARDARGWCRLELRDDGSLWAVGVAWTPDGAARLSEKRQRYVSPAFEADPKTRRVLKMINVAITAMPATHGTPALLAKGAGMDPSLVKAALEAIQKGDAKAALEILTNLVASAAGADPEPDGDEDGSADDGAEGVAPPAEAKEKAEYPEVVDNSAPPAKDGGDGAEDDDDDPPAKKTERKAMCALLCRLAERETLAETVAEVEVWRASHVALQSERAKLAKDRATLEAEERRNLLASLVKLGAEFPSTVWADDKARKPKARWAKMPIEELRAHVQEQRAARGSKAPAARGPQPPPGDASPTGALPDTAVTLDNGQVVQLSALECQYAKEAGAELKDYAALKVLRGGKGS